MDDARSSRAEAPIHMGAKPIQGFVRDSWYVVAFSHEVTDAKPLARRCCGDPIVLFRDARGKAAALHDRCPHRGVPLSQGAPVEGALQCVYHGFRFGPDGACTLVPSQRSIPPQMRTRAYPLVERAGFVWLWPGDPAKADAALLPDHREIGLEREGWSVTPYFMLEIRSNYAMLFENLLDTSHVTYLHGGFLDTGDMASATFTTEFGENRAKLVRSIPKVIPSRLIAKQYNLVEGESCTRENTALALMPNLSIVQNRYSFPDQPGKPDHFRVNVMPITPATMTTHYQFLTMASSYVEPDHETVKAMMLKVLKEDQVVLEAMQALYDEFGDDLPECSVRADVAGIKARRMLRDLATRES